VEYATGISLNGAPPQGSVTAMTVLRNTDGTWSASGDRWNKYGELPAGCLPSFEMKLNPQQQESLESVLLAIAGMTCEPELEGTDDFDWPYRGLYIDDVQVANNHGCEWVSSPYDSKAIDLTMAVLERIAMEESQGACLSQIGFERETAAFLAPGCAAVGEAKWVKASFKEVGYIIEGEVVRALEEEGALLEYVGPSAISSKEVNALISLAMKLPGPSDARALPETCTACEACGSEYLVAFPMFFARDHYSTTGSFDEDGLESSFASWSAGCRGEWPDAEAAQAAESLAQSLADLLTDAG
jgi:hypothetical protein